MKITKGMGRAALLAAEASAKSGRKTGGTLAWEALDELTGEWAHNDMWPLDAHLTGLCLCAAIAGVKPK